LLDWDADLVWEITWLLALDAAIVPVAAAAGRKANMALAAKPATATERRVLIPIGYPFCLSRVFALGQRAGRVNR
jgi:hypothetical protein